MPSRPVQILAISGSLRPRSVNTAMIQAARLLARPDTAVKIYDGLGTLPHFNPDLDAEGAIPPPEVAHLRHAMAAADAVLICSPEYAHGVPGSLKNMLDWLVSTKEFPGKPVALINASLVSVHAHAQLIEILSTMSASLVPAGGARIPILNRAMTAEGIAADEDLSRQITAVLRSLGIAVRESASTAAQ